MPYRCLTTNWKWNHYVVHVGYVPSYTINTFIQVCFLFKITIVQKRTKCKSLETSITQWWIIFTTPSRISKWQNILGVSYKCLITIWINTFTFVESNLMSWRYSFLFNFVLFLLFQKHKLSTWYSKGFETSISDEKSAYGNELSFIYTEQIGTFDPWKATSLKIPTSNVFYPWGYFNVHSHFNSDIYQMCIFWIVNHHILNISYKFFFFFLIFLRLFMVLLL